MTMYCNLLFVDFLKVQSFGMFYLFRWLTVDNIINRKKLAMMKLHNCEHPDERQRNKARHDGDAMRVKNINKSTFH